MVKASADNSSTGLEALAAAVAKSAGAIHDRIVETGTNLTFPAPRDAGHYIARLVELGAITAQEAQDLNALVKEVQDETAPSAFDRITGAAAVFHDRSNVSPVAAAISGIAVASATRAARAVTFSVWSTVGADVLGGVIGGVSGAIAGEMVGGKVGAAFGAGFGAVLVGGLASSE